MASEALNLSIYIYNYLCSTCLPFLGYNAANSYKYDFALLKLAQTVTTSDSIAPICLPENQSGK